MDSSKPYLVIARKYRPRTFDDVMGQDAVATTLKNAVTLNRVGHAYLFSGPRGVGKTSMARIFAKALNCQRGSTVEPCGTCQACVEIENSRSLDVLEIDGASNRGIDEIRALRENVKFAPAAGKFKIYIIDEVHQITSEAFNALLKTLEEPPAHVKFIFATTASHKVPATILSRCQRFDFKRIPTETIAKTLKAICAKERISIDDQALFAIAKAADGSLRDGQSILDQVAAASEGKISAKSVKYSLGAVEEEILFQMTEALAAGDARAALLLLHETLEDGKDPALFLEKLLEHVRNLLFAQISDKLVDLIEEPDTYKRTLAKQKALLTQDELFYCFGVITHAMNTLKRFEAKRIPIEMALVKLALRAPMTDLSRALEALKSAPASPTNGPAAQKKTLDEDEDKAPDIEELPSDDVVLPRENKIKFISLDSVWEPLVRAVKNEKISLASYLAEGSPRELKNGIARISFAERHTFHRETLELEANRKLIEKHLSALLSEEVRVEFESTKDPAGAKNEAVESTFAEAMDESVKSAMNLFGGRLTRE